MVLLGIDVSEYQGQVDWPTVARAGVAFAFAKVSEGTTYHDKQYGRNRVEIPKAGLVPGGYHYLRATSPAASQADTFCALVDPQAVHALDVEAAEHLDVPGWVARYRTHFPTHPLVIYTGRDLWARAGGGNGSGHGPLWAAGVAPNAYLPGAGTLADLWSRVGAQRSGLPWAGWTSAAFLQFTASAQVPGVSGPVDGNAYLPGDRSSLVALTSVNPAPAPAPAPAPDPAVAQIAAAVVAALAGDTPDAVTARTKIMQVVWSAAWPAPTTTDPQAVETAAQRLVAAARSAGLLPYLDGLATTVRALPDAVAAAVAARLPAGAVDAKALATAVAAELAARLAS